MHVPRGLLVLLACLLLAGCEPAGVPTASPAEPTPGPTPTATTAVTPLATPAQPTPAQQPSPTAEPVAVGGPPSPGCIDGWSAPVPGSAEYEEGMEIVSGYMGEDGPWVVEEMRYFTGPDAPWIVEPRYEVVERWYIKASLADEEPYHGRWLLEKRTERILGVSAVASYESTGYDSPDWLAFVGDGPHVEYPGLPGRWSGIPYDFVTGEGDHGQPGLPDEVVDCLAGT